MQKKKRIAQLPTQIDISTITTGKIMYENSRKICLLSSNTENIYIQTPLFENILEKETHDTHEDWFFLIKPTKEGNDFLEFISNIEQHIIKLSFKNKQQWFGTTDNVKFRSIIKTFEGDSENNKIIKLKIAKTVKTVCSYVDSVDTIQVNESYPIKMNEITDGYIRCILCINAIWIKEDIFGLYLKPVYIEEIKVCDYEFQETTTPYYTMPFIDSEINPDNKLIAEQLADATKEDDEMDISDEEEEEVEEDNCSNASNKIK